MGRPRVHDQATARVLLRTAEQIAEAEGPQAISVRRVAEAAGVSVRGVYSVFGAKDGLLAALGAQAFDLLGEAVRELPVTADPAADLVDVAAVFRGFVLGHPSLFRIGVQNDGTDPQVVARIRPAASAALAHLRFRVARLVHPGGENLPDDLPVDLPADLAGDLPTEFRADVAAVVQSATLQFHALCEGLAALELRGRLPKGAEEQVWRSGFSALVTGLGAPREAAEPEEGKTVKPRSQC